MKIELQIKVIDFKMEDVDPEELKLNRLLGKDDEESVGIETKYTYKPYVLDLRDIAMFGMDDENHTKVMTNIGLFYVKLDYITFCRIYESGTYTQIKRLSDFKLVKK